MPKKILITGASGFIGANLLKRLLQEPLEIHALVTPHSDLWRIEENLHQICVHKLELEQFDELERLMKEISPSAIFHLAAHGAAFSQQDQHKIFSSNVLGTFNLLKATENIDYDFFAHIGGSSEYGHLEKPMREDTALEPTTFYGVSKACATLIVQQFARCTQKPISLLRLFSVYGPLESPNRFIPTAIRAALTGEPLQLTPPGFVRDFIFVEDVIEALLHVWEKKVSGKIFNIGTGIQTTNEQVVKILEELTEKPIEISETPFPPRMMDKKIWVADTSKTECILGWRARFSLREGLIKSLSAHHQHVY
jgi:nucleoside-diphosphate-sugar epimerase